MELFDSLLDRLIATGTSANVQHFSLTLLHYCPQYSISDYEPFIDMALLMVKLRATQGSPTFLERLRLLYCVSDVYFASANILLHHSSSSSSTSTSMSEQQQQQHLYPSNLVVSIAKYTQWALCQGILTAVLDSAKESALMILPMERVQSALSLIKRVEDLWRSHHILPPLLPPLLPSSSSSSYTQPTAVIPLTTPFVPAGLPLSSLSTSPPSAPFSASTMAPVAFDVQTVPVGMMVNMFRSMVSTASSSSSSSSSSPPAPYTPLPAGAASIKSIRAPPVEQGRLQVRLAAFLKEAAVIVNGVQHQPPNLTQSSSSSSSTTTLVYAKNTNTLSHARKRGGNGNGHQKWHNNEGTMNRDREEYGKRSTEIRFYGLDAKDAGEGSNSYDGGGGGGGGGGGEYRGLGFG